MAYTPWSVVFGEAPSTSKWAILGANDSSFNDGTGIGTGVIQAVNMVDRTRRFHFDMRGDNVGGGGAFTTLNEGSPEIGFSGTPSAFGRAVGMIPMDYVPGTNATLKLLFQSASANNQQLQYYIGAHSNNQAFTSWNVASALTSGAIGVSASTSKEFTLATINSSFLTAGGYIAVAIRPTSAVTNTLWVTAIYIDYTADM